MSDDNNLDPKINVDIKADIGTSFDKLVDVISNGLGRRYEPKHIRKTADAEAYALEQKTIAKAKAMNIIADANMDILQRAQERFAHKLINQQNNVEEIVEGSFTYLPDDVDDNSVETDWITRFFNVAENISDQDMQKIWSKILAGEVATPGIVSKRTLDIVGNISKSEAELFQNICTLVSGGGGNSFGYDYSYIYKLGSNSRLSSFGLDFMDIQLLLEAGLIQPGSSIQKKLAPISHNPHIPLMIGKTPYLGIPKHQNHIPKAHILLLTTAGTELSNLLDKELDLDYLEAVKTHFDRAGLTLHHHEEMSVEAVSSSQESDNQ